MHDQAQSNAPMTLEDKMNGIRGQLKQFGEMFLAIKKDVAASEVNSIEDRPEELANLTLAYRHMEDCIMRLGKVIQAYQGGKSIYDKPAGIVAGNAPGTGGAPMTDKKA